MICYPIAILFLGVLAAAPPLVDIGGGVIPGEVIENPLPPDLHPGSRGRTD